ncbi:hypothetical protein SGLAM104S_00471 [Streptomyces glaucescens]
MLLGFAAHADEIEARLAARGAERAAVLVRHVRAALERTAAAAAGLDRGDPAAAVRQLDLAERLCLLHPAAAAALAWRAHPSAAVRRGTRRRRWLTAVLAVLLAHAEGRAPRQAAPDVPPAGRALARLDDARLLFTALPVPLADGPGTEEPEEGTRRHDRPDRAHGRPGGSTWATRGTPGPSCRTRGSSRPTRTSGIRTEFVDVLASWGLYDWIVPAANGGKAVNVEDGFNLYLLVGRRDPTSATAMVLTSLSSCRCR